MLALRRRVLIAGLYLPWFVITFDVVRMDCSVELFLWAAIMPKKKGNRTLPRLQGALGSRWITGSMFCSHTLHEWKKDFLSGIGLAFYGFSAVERSCDLSLKLRRVFTASFLLAYGIRNRIPLIMV